MEVQQPDFDVELFNQLWKHKLIDKKGFVIADDKQLRKFKAFLEEQSREKTTEMYKTRKKQVDEVQRLMKGLKKSPGQNKNIVSLVESLRLDFDKKGYLDTTIHEKPSKKPSPKFKGERKPLSFVPPTFTMVSKKVAERKEKAKATKRELEVLGNWLNKIDSAEAKKPMPPTDAAFKEMRQASMERNKRRSNEMDIGRKRVVKERHAEHDAYLKKILGPYRKFIRPYEVKKSYREPEIKDHEPRSTPEFSPLAELENKWQSRRRSTHTPEASLRDVDESTMERLKKPKRGPKFGKVKGKYSKTAVKKIFSDSDLIYPKFIRTLSDEHKDPIQGLTPKTVTLEELGKMCESDIGIKRMTEKFLRDIDEATRQKTERLDGRFELSEGEIKRDTSTFVKKIFSDSELIKPGDRQDSSGEYKDHTPGFTPENVSLQEMANRRASDIDIRYLPGELLKDVDESTRKKLEEIVSDPTVRKVEGTYANAVVKKVFSESKIISPKNIRALSDEHKDPAPTSKPEIATLEELANRCASDIDIQHAREELLRDIDKTAMQKYEKAEGHFESFVSEAKSDAKIIIEEDKELIKFVELSKAMADEESLIKESSSEQPLTIQDKLDIAQQRLSLVTSKDVLKPAEETSSERLRRRGSKVGALGEWPKVVAMENNFPDVANAILERARAFKKNKGLILNNTLYRKLSESKFKKKDKK